MDRITEAYQKALDLVDHLASLLPAEARNPASLTKIPSRAVVARAWKRAQNLRHAHFSVGVFSDPAWDMLLDLYVNHHVGRRISVSSLCVASNVPATTALRWIQLLRDEGLVERWADSSDARRYFVVLTDKGIKAIETVIDEAMAEEPRLGLGRLQLA